MSAKDANYSFGRQIGVARANWAASKRGRPVVAVMTVEEYERLKVFEGGRVDGCPSPTGRAQ
ncbi:type II toxin-antitoxin system prevent-host-death family antitoxin [Bradyrhizobium sp. dw_78]|uniref:type II toxin-antitoxin system prevent-host-death family antitoxin n=1 Tax=Bradyrhizobium sp. dw_78 TaxID=2719793 RepID=UPI001C49F9FD|nr:type II toxin-antitoxin system prevent-host-death family antitoxin [Bradyrhizobium sp. dw_78]